jgi:Fe-S-cluster containining protein
MDDAPPETTTAHVKLETMAGAVELEVTVPNALVILDQFLPVARELTEGLVELGVSVAERQGKTVSCRAGCGACCRQLVPIAEVEARRVGRLVEEMPEPRRSLVKARFSEARERLEAAGLLEKLEKVDEWVEGDSRRLGIDYFREGIACPFLENESCSIHPDRPIACREYLVTSPAENCTAPSAETVCCVKLPSSVWNALARFDPPRPGSTAIRWVPLVLARSWAESHPELPQSRPGPELLRELIDRVVGSGTTPSIASESSSSTAELDGLTQ